MKPRIPLGRSARQHRFALHWVTDDLAVGPAPAARDLATMRRFEVRGLVDLRTPEERDGAPTSFEGIERYDLAVPDEGIPTWAQLEAVSDWILLRMTPGTKTLVACREGRGRSVFVVCAVLLALGHPLDRAYQLVTRAQPRVRFSEQQANALVRLAAATEVR